MRIVIIFVFLWAAFVLGRSYESDHPVKKAKRVIEAHAVKAKAVGDFTIGELRDLWEKCGE